MKTAGRMYRVRDRWGNEVSRPNRLAAGMTKQGRFKKDEARTLSVYGTLDILRGMFNHDIKRSLRVCPCCGQRSNRYVLSDMGRTKLARLRKRVSV